MSDAELDYYHLTIMDELNRIRSRVIRIESMMRVMHNARHPMLKPPLDLSPTQPLEPEVRADIDATP